MLTPMDLPREFWVCVAFLFGACIGSFLNVCIYRIPREESIVRPRSRCPACGASIAWFDNIPILSWLSLRARCRACRAPISPRYALVETLTAVLFAWITWLYGWSPITAAYGLAISGLVLATFVDLDEMYIPDRVSIGGIVAGLILSPLIPALHGASTAWDGFLASAIGAAAGWSSLWLLAWGGERIFGKEAMGMGDIKLMSAIGAFLGWRGVVFVFFASSLVGAAFGLSMVACRRKALHSAIPFGPYLAFAAVAWILGGHRLWGIYIDFMINLRLGGLGG